MCTIGHCGSEAAASSAYWLALLSPSHWTQYGGVFTCAWNAGMRCPLADQMISSLSGDCLQVSTVHSNPLQQRCTCSNLGRGTAIAGGPMVTIGLFIFAWTIYPWVHWIAPIIGSALFGAG